MGRDYFENIIWRVEVVESEIWLKMESEHSVAENDGYNGGKWRM